MSVEKRITADITMLEVNGDLCGSNVEELRATAGACLAAGRRDFVIDLTDAHLCDSEGLESLTWLQRECEDRLGLVKLCGLSDTLVTILEITKLNVRFADYDETF